MATINTNILKKVDSTNPNATEAIYNAMLEDLIERRNPRDPDLFCNCMERMIPEDHRYSNAIEDFTELAGAAFADYHALRARGAHMEDGNLVVPTPPSSDDAGEDRATETEDDPADVDGDAPGMNLNALSDINNYTESDTIIEYLTDIGESITERYIQEDKTDAVFKDHFFTELSNLICFSDCSGYRLQQATFRGRAVHYSGWLPGMVFVFEDDNGTLIWTGRFPEWEH